MQCVVYTRKAPAGWSYRSSIKCIIYVLRARLVGGMNGVRSQARCGSQWQQLHSVRLVITHHRRLEQNNQVNVRRRTIWNQLGRIAFHNQSQTLVDFLGMISDVVTRTCPAAVPMLYIDCEAYQTISQTIDTVIVPATMRDLSRSFSISWSTGTA